MTAYYNEHDPKAAAWLRELIKAGHIADGVVDERSIEDVVPSELNGYTQCHFFAGIGGWSYALRLAGWPDDRPVWTGSCPCQPFSSAGKGLAQKDERHLWPVFARLMAECRPNCVFGEQVTGAIGKGWLDGVQRDLEREGYAVGHCVLGAHSVGAPHIRQRLYWVADGNDAGPQRRNGKELRECADQRVIGKSGPSGGMANAESERSREGQQDPRGCVCGSNAEQGGKCERGGSTGGVVQSSHTGPQQRDTTTKAAGHGDTIEPAGGRPWDNSTTILCRDGKTRRIPLEPAFFPLSDGVPARVVRLRGYGNAIVPQAAAAFIEAYLEVGEE